MPGDLTTALVLQMAGIVLLIAEIFLPSHGLLTIMALACLGSGIYMAFKYGETAGYLSILATVIILPTFAVLAVKVWPRTPFGRRIAPPNRPADITDVPTAQVELELQKMLGKKGRALTPLRPVGTCEFDGQRLECIAETGIVQKDSTVVAVAVQGRSLIVRPCEPSADSDAQT